jgi:hypothetical protein
VNRPAHIDPRWWERATWRAKKAAVEAHERRHRETADARNAVTEARIAELRANVEAARREHVALYGNRIATNDLDEIVKRVDQLLEWGATMQAISNDLGLSAGSLEARMRRAERDDLRRLFAVARYAKRYKPCPECGKRMEYRSKACRSCTSRAMVRRAA